MPCAAEPLHFVLQQRTKQPPYTIMLRFMLSPKRASTLLLLLAWLPCREAWELSAWTRREALTVTSLLLNHPSPPPPQTQQQYDALATSYDNVQDISESLGLSEARAQLLQKARGNVLEIGVGTFQSLPFYQWDQIQSFTALDLSANMLKEARRKVLAANNSSVLTNKIQFVQADATTNLKETLGGPTFDTIVDTFSLCVLGDALALQCLQQLQTVLQPQSGQLLLLENARSSNPLLGLYQDVTVDLTSQLGGRGCRYNQDVTKLIQQAGWSIQNETSYLSGLFRAYQCTLPS